MILNKIHWISTIGTHNFSIGEDCRFQTTYVSF